MLQLKRNDLLIGFTISVLLSIFVNFALLMRKYEFETGNPSMGIQPPDRTMYYLLIWFFVFSFILFIVNSLLPSSRISMELSMTVRKTKRCSVMKELGTVKGLGGTGMSRCSAGLMVCVAILSRLMRIMISRVAG